MEKTALTPEQFMKASREYSDASTFMHEAIARRAGLSGADHKYLGIILQHGQLTAGELSKLTGITTGAVTHLIDRLEKKKLLKRQFSDDDRRKVIIVPDVENVMNLLRPLFTELQEKTAVLLASFTDAEVRTIQRYFIGAATVMQEVTRNLNDEQE